MCIHNITTITDKKEQHGFGWKVFHPLTYKSRHRRLRNPVMTSDKRLVYSSTYASSVLRQVGVWYKASRCEVTSVYSEPYMSGFHIFSGLKSAKKYAAGTSCVIARVEYKGAHTKGVQFGNGRTIVADYMKIVEIYTQSGRTVWKCT